MLMQIVKFAGFPEQEYLDYLEQNNQLPAVMEMEKVQRSMEKAGAKKAKPFKWPHEVDPDAEALVRAMLTFDPR